MYSHVTRSRTQTWLGFTRYQLTAQIHATPEEREIIRHHRLTHIEIFHDPLREEYHTRAATAHDAAKARGLLLFKARDAGAVCASELRALIATTRALRAFHVSAGDLLHGVTIRHRSLQAIVEVERAIIACIDAIERSVAAARSYAHSTEDIFAPGHEEDAAEPTAEWTRHWRS